MVGRSRVLGRSKTKKKGKSRVIGGKKQVSENGKNSLNPRSLSQNVENSTEIIELEEEDYTIEEPGHSLGDRISLNITQELTPVGRLIKEQMERMSGSINHMYEIIEPLAKNPNEFTKELIVAHKTVSEIIKNFVTLTKLLKEEFKDDDKDNKALKGNMIDVYTFMMNYECESCRNAIIEQFGEFLLDVERNEQEKRKD